MNLFMNIDLKRNIRPIENLRNSFTIDNLRKILEIKFVSRNIISVDRQIIKIDISQNKYRTIGIPFPIFPEWSFLDEYIPNKGQYFMN